jgi:hypothetical protein
VIQLKKGFNGVFGVFVLFIPDSLFSVDRGFNARLNS